MDETKYCRMPIATCPHCEDRFQQDDYSEITEGGEIDCPKCRKNIYVKDVEWVIYARLSVNKNQ